MKLVILIGNSAVGKMTVGQKLAEITGLKLFYNHMTIEPVIELFGYYNGRVVSRLRQVIFEEFAASDNDGLIFTYMWAFDQPSDWEYIRRLTALFEEKGAEVFYAELIAPQEIRLQRNATENRLKHKPSKRDIELSNQRLREDDQKYRCESLPGEIPFENYLRIENANLPPEEAAKRIKERFHL